MTEILLVITNMPDAASAGVLAARIIEAQVAACVNQLAPCTSTYRWQGQMETVTEAPLLIKTTAMAYAQLETLIRSAHPYDVPEIIAIPVACGLPDYLNWVKSETRKFKE